MSKSANEQKKLDLELLRCEASLDIAEFDRLISEGANINAISKDHGDTLLISVIKMMKWLDNYQDRKRSHEFIHHILRTTGINIHVLNNDGWNALLLASSNQDNELVDLLRQKGAGPDVIYRNCIASHIAVINQDFELLQCIMDNGGNCNAINSHHQSLLMGVVMLRNVECLNILMRQGNLNVNYVNEENKETALMVAARFGFVDGVKALLARGADISIEDYSHKTALDNAEATYIAIGFEPCEEVIDLLRAKEAENVRKEEECLRFFKFVGKRPQSFSKQITARQETRKQEDVTPNQTAPRTFTATRSSASSLQQLQPNLSRQ